MPSYTIYGLRIQSNLDLPTLNALPSAPTQHDVTLRMNELPNWDAALLERAARRGELQDGASPSTDPDAPFVWRTEAHGEKFERWLFDNKMLFIISEKGDKIWATWPPDVSLGYVTTYLLGPVLGYVVYLQNMLCIHASAVLIGGKAIGVMGVGGAGKSTTSAALAGMGYPLISEDHLALTQKDGLWMAQPGYPIVRLWPDSARLIAGDNKNLPELAPGFKKQYLNLAGTPMLANQPAPLAKLYVLLPRINHPDAPHAKPLDAQQRLMAVVRNSYATLILNKKQKASEFAQLAKLATQIPVMAVTPHADPARLPDLCRLIIQDACQQPAI